MESYRPCYTVQILWTSFDTVDQLDVMDEVGRGSLEQLVGSVVAQERRLGLTASGANL